MGSLFSTANFMPHGICIAWDPPIVGLHVVSDLLIIAAYFSIPFAILVFTRRRPDFRQRPVAYLFTMFIFWCGMTHAASIMTLWVPAYGVEGIVKAICAFFSVWTAMALWPLLPKLLALPSPDQLQEANKQLVAEIDARRAAFAGLEEVRLDLERRVEERTLYLETEIRSRKQAADELVAARAAAERANQLKTRFLSMMSHELRTPLNAVLGHCQLLLVNAEVAASEKLRNSIDVITRSGEHLLSLINQILDLNAIENGDIKLSIENVDVHLLVAECVDLEEAMAQQRDIEVVTAPELQTELIVKADYVRLRQVFLNILSNAVKYNRREGRIMISVKPGAPDGSVRLAVADTGRGIPEDKLEQVFDPFNRLDADQSGEEGTGIGLTIARTLMGEMNGAIGVRSTVGEGTVFWLDIPEGSRRPGVTRLKGGLTNTAWPAGPRGPFRLLYVEDNPSNIDLMRHVADEVPNFSLSVATTAEEGLALADNDQPDFIVLDIQLPGMDGIAALRELRRNDRTRDIPVIALSASILTADRQNAHASGFDAFLAKPLNIAEFLGLLAQLDARAPV